MTGRVCAIRKTEEAIRIAQEGIRKEASRKGRQVQPQTLEFVRYVIVFTTFPAADFTGSEVLDWYRLRWQVELVFKRFKSLAELGHLPKHDDESAKAWLYGKLLAALLVEKLIDHATAVSPWGYRLAAPSATRTAASTSSNEPVTRAARQSGKALTVRPSRRQRNRRIRVPAGFTRA